MSGISHRFIACKDTAGFCPGASGAFGLIKQDVYWRGSRRGGVRGVLLQQRLQRQRYGARQG
jgi:hypothetical protein